MVGFATSLLWTTTSLISVGFDGEAQPWTFLIYGAADNNADGPILSFLDDVRQAWDDDPGIEMLLFLDRSREFSNDATALGEDFTGARLYRLRKDSAERLAGGEEFPEMTLDSEFECDSGNPENLRKFISFAKRHYPARRYGLMIYSHADGIAMCPDEESGTEMGIPELTEVLGEDEAVDFLGLELCNMGGIEIAYQWRPGNGGFYAETLVAIPNAGPPLDWGRAFARVRSPSSEVPLSQGQFDPAHLTAEQFAKLLIEEGGKGRLEHVERHPQDAERARFEAVAAYDLFGADAVKEAVDQWAIQLSATNAKDVMMAVRGPGSAGCVMNYTGSELADRPYVDLYDLARRCASHDEFAPEAREAAQVVMESLDEFVLASFAMSGYEGFAPGKNGVFIVLPGEESVSRGMPGSSRWSQFDWYTPLEASRSTRGSGRWAWCADGAEPANGTVENWFEMLDQWFDGERAGSNGYRW